jgi:flagellar hook protein FlgE
MDVSFNASLSGLKTTQLREDISANNVANLNTPGFQASQGIQTEMSPSGTRISAIVKTPNSNSADSNTDLATEMVNQQINKNDFAANAQVIKAKDKMLGALLDIFG